MSKTATLNERQKKGETHLDLVIKDLHKVEIVRCLADNLTSMDFQPGAPAPSIDCAICVYSTLCLRVRKAISNL
ncbi:hypothetical protein ES703_121298 [subsurface metagenome]